MSSAARLLLLLHLPWLLFAAPAHLITSILATSPHLRLLGLANFATLLHLHPALAIPDLPAHFVTQPHAYALDDVDCLASERNTASAEKALQEMRIVQFSVGGVDGAIRVDVPTGSVGLINRSLLKISPALSGTESSRRVSSPSSAPSPLSAPAPASAPAPSLVNITQIVESAGQFDTFLSLLTATNVADHFQSQANKTTTGITIFAPIDKAFSSLPSGLISRLTAQQKISVCEFHALSAFYPLLALQQATAPFTPTLATDNNGAGKFTVNISNQEGTVVISTGLTNATLISTLYNTVPCGLFAINQVLLPEDIFGVVAPSQAPTSFPPVASSPLLSGFFPNTAAAGPSPEVSNVPSAQANRQLLSVVLVVCGWTLFLL